MIKRLATAGIRFYKAWVSPLLPSACRYYPTCSRYTLDAVNKYGTLQGLWMGIKRLCRCHPWHPGGYDPVDQDLT